MEYDEPTPRFDLWETLARDGVQLRDGGNGENLTPDQLSRALWGGDIILPDGTLATVYIFERPEQN